MTAASPYTMTVRGTLGYVRLSEPVAFASGPAKYSASLQLHRSIDAGQILEIEAACMALGREHNIRWRDLKICLVSRYDDEDILHLNAANLDQPSYPADVKSGDRVEFTVQFWFSGTRWGNRVNAKLISVSTDL